MRTEEERLNLPPKKAGAAAGLGMARNGAFKHIDYSAQQVASSASIATGPLAAQRADVQPVTKHQSKQPKRFVPNSLLSLIALDVTFISLAQALILTYLHQRLNLEGAEQITIVILLSLLFTMGSLYASGCYRRDSLSRFSTAIAPLAVAIGLAATLLILTMNFALAAMYPDMVVYRSISRCFTITLIMTAIALPICSVNRAFYFAMVRRHWFVRRVLVVGTGTRAAYLEALLGSDAHRAHSQMFFLSESALGGTPASHPMVQSPILGSGLSVEDVAAELGADEVVIAVDEKRGLAIERLLSCKTTGIPIIEYDALIERETGRIDLRWLELSWLVYSPGFEIKLLDTILKRTLDLVVSAGLLIVSLPAMLMAMAAIKFEDRGPLFYKQTRVTQGGREFWIYKLRTMRVDAEAQGAQWAAKNDARTTRVGNFLRKSRIDEIPQLWNVLAGDMSLVGPRPERPVFIEQLSKQIPMYNFRHGVKAGLTGWAQINYPYGASVEDARAKLEYDLYYMKNYNVLRDLSIMLQTFRILVWRGGAR